MLYKAGLVYLLIMTSVTLSILFLLFTVGLQQPCAQTLQDDLLQSGTLKTIQETPFSTMPILDPPKGNTCISFLSPSLLPQAPSKSQPVSTS